MKKRVFQNFSMIVYGLVFGALAFLIYEVGSINSRVAAIEYRQELQNSFDLSNIRRGALRTTPADVEQSQ